MIAINYPEPAFDIRREGEKPYIFDTLRRTWLLLTEEEWVRQNFIRYLVEVLRYPAALIAVEKEIVLNGLKKRFDLLVFDRNHRPWMLVECKAPHVVLNEAVLQQVLRYHISVPVPYLVITNGNTTYGWRKVESALQQLQVLPGWS
ncbi:type I restriction enzyme HsdR N-terminal domain-containing protein [Paraflavisolibacter sp. H34]|uniref:type I restriction enzyme HsdR N-terminal domain-containing protein n=1 Tax=Huijunlia imazamoxiresistens TaxID=3127457 RepID=UPI003018275D